MTPHERDPLVVHGPRLQLRYPRAEDAARLFELASDPQVTRWFSWGPYTEVAQASAWIDAQPARREAGEIMDFLVVGEQGALGVTGLTEIARRDRRATVGSWLGQPYWGSGVNFEAKAMVAALAFQRLGMERLTAWANTRNGRSQRALERVGFRREGVLRAWHRHGEEMHDVVVFALVRGVWERSALAEVPVRIEGTPPPAFIVS
ncbi:GNAT family N-acetyltransferase [Solirubrobacter sp. CPCC 204708]|uniref:GNAT family N-acetyltransferase n=1 Tax=Solirubrobacter deserti TaxID=2282478 RepID=A0ABT4RIZ2_9ACTN|nr:GNAT family N-acetyltransferase [Solirubrobacter deserti]MBE2320849.1 GNAT family N-acetyltransferase [Solirubrobacter deserti]MDA0138483.1 GNAT family N-acetyltransferase [Solirubrobacter deserti]